VTIPGWSDGATGRLPIGSMGSLPQGFDRVVTKPLAADPLAAARVCRLKFAGKRYASLAVLPLENLSRDTEQEWFSDGMAWTLISELSKDAITLHRELARAIARALQGMGDFAQAPNARVVPEARAELRKAIELEPDLAEAYSRPSWSYVATDRDWEAVEQEARKQWDSTRLQTSPASCLPAQALVSLALPDEKEPLRSAYTKGGWEALKALLKRLRCPEAMWK
jgi:hypothetical protein